MHHYHFYDLSSMGADIPEHIELKADNLQDAILEVIKTNVEAGNQEPLQHDKDFRLVKLQPFKVSEPGGNEEIFWAENLDQAGRLALLDIFDTSVDPIV